MRYLKAVGIAVLVVLGLAGLGLAALAFFVHLIEGFNR